MAEIQRLRTSERRSFKTCPMQWQWAWREGLTLRRVYPDARWFGTGIHLALAERYKYRGLRRGRDVLKVWRDYVNGEVLSIRTVGNPEFGIGETPEAEWMDAQELGEIMLGGYLDLYGKDERWYNVAVEQTFEVIIPRPLYVGAQDGKTVLPLVIYNGTFDGVRRDEWNDGALWLWENKTAAQIRLTHLSLDDQAGSYWAIAADWMNAQGIKFAGGQLHGIMYDFLRKGKPDTERTRDELGRIRNKPTKQHFYDALEQFYPDVASSKNTLNDLADLADKHKLTVYGDVSKVQGSPLFVREEVWRTAAERRTQIKRIQNEALHMEAMRTRALPLYKSPGMNTCGGCDFKNMCELHEQNADWKEFRAEMYDVRDVYADHRKSADAST